MGIYKYLLIFAALFWRLTTDRYKTLHDALFYFLLQ